MTLATCFSCLLFLVVYLDGGGQLVGGLPRDFVLVFLSLSLLFKSLLRRGLLHNADGGRE